MSQKKKKSLRLDVWHLTDLIKYSLCNQNVSFDSDVPKTAKEGEKTAADDPGAAGTRT